VPQFHLYLRKGDISIPGLPGFQQFSHVDEACDAAIQSIRDIAKQATLAGRELNVETVDIIDEGGNVLLSVFASDVIELPEQHQT
jgi:hypothetical protein